MNKNDLLDSVGVHISHINSDDFHTQINRFSDLGDNWSLPSECPKCGRYIEFNKQNINKLITCKCGQKICCQVSEELL